MSNEPKRHALSTHFVTYAGGNAPGMGAQKVLDVLSDEFDSSEEFERVLLAQLTGAMEKTELDSLSISLNGRPCKIELCVTIRARAINPKNGQTLLLGDGMTMTGVNQPLCELLNAMVPGEREQNTLGLFDDQDLPIQLEGPKNEQGIADTAGGAESVGECSEGAGI